MAKNSKVALTDITVSPNRMRTLRPEKVDEIARSIKDQGLLQPIIVRPRPVGGLVFF